MPLAKVIDWTDSSAAPRGQSWPRASWQKMGPVMGFSITARNEPTVYWAGDTALYPAVETIITDTRPEIIIIHACGARWDGDLITMDATWGRATCRLAPDASVIATHMELLDHATVSRDELRRHATAQGVSPQQLLIPLDGETLQLSIRGTVDDHHSGRVRGTGMTAAASPHPAPAEQEQTLLAEHVPDPPWQGQGHRAA